MSTSREEAGVGGLARVVARGMKSTGAALVLVALIQLVHLAVLARLLRPADMGAVSALMILTGLLDILSDLGFSNATIQRSSISDTAMSTLYWLNVLTGIVIAGALYASSGLLAGAFSNSSLEVLFQLAALIYLVVPHGQQFRAVLEKRMRFGPLAVGDVSAAFVGAAASICLAASGTGPACFVIGAVLGAVVRVAIARATARRYFSVRLTFVPSSVKGAVRFGLLQLLDAVVSYFGANAASAAVGTNIGLRELGGYNIASNAVVNTPAKINPVLTRVMFPTLALIQHDRARIARGFQRLTVAAGLVNVPLLAFAAVFSHQLIQVLFGSRWTWILPIWILLCGVGMLRALGNPMGILLLSLNKMGVGLAINMGKTLVTIGLVSWGAAAGSAVGAATALLVAQSLSIPLNAELLQRLTGLPRRSYWRACLTVPLLTLPAAGVWFVPNLVPVDSVLISVSCALAGGLLLAIILKTSRSPEIRDIISVIGLRSSAR